MQKASLYHHFPSKEDLFIACVTEAFDGAARKLDTIRTDAALDDQERIRAAMDEIYRINLSTPVGRMAPMIAEVAQLLPEVANAFHGGFINRQYAVMSNMIEDGIKRGSYTETDVLGLQHLIFGPVITLALSREMIASFPDRDVLYPIEHIKSSHIRLVMKLLVGPANI